MKHDDVFDAAPAADVAEQRRNVRDEVADEEAAVTGPDNPPAESTAADWQEQVEAVDTDLDADEFGRES